MARIYFRQHQSPGCGGCLLLVLLGLLLFGNMPMVFNFLGVILFIFLLLVLGGIAAFSFFTHYIRRKVGLYAQSQTEAHNRFVSLLIHILVKIARIDGTVTKEELGIIDAFFRHNLHYNQTQMYWVKEMIKEASTASETLDELLAEFRGNFAYEPRLILVELIYQVLYTKRVVPEAEIALARRIAEYLGISEHEQRTIHMKYQSRSRAATTSDEDSYRVLGLEPGADFAAVKRAYRQLSMQYHPDKVAHLGEEFRKVAEEKMKEINAAYQTIKKKQG